MAVSGPRELQWEVDGLVLAGMAWGSADKPPILALHGWLDNAASFARLAPLLPDYYVVAVDLTGHGRSSHRSPDATYQIWDDIPQITGVIEQLGWQRFSVIGHSRGAMIASILCGVMAEHVDHLVLLDSFFPQTMDGEDFVGQFQQFLRDRRKLMARTPRNVANLEEAIAAREVLDLSPEAARFLVERGTQPADDGSLQWSYDQRLRGSSAVKFTAAQRDALITSLTMPLLMVLAADGMKKDRADMEQSIATMKNFAPQLRLEYRPGGHHFHMEDGVESIAELINSFLRGD